MRYKWTNWVLALQKQQICTIVQICNIQVNHYQWHQSWNAPPSTSLCSHPLAGLLKCSASMTISRCNFWHTCNRILVARFNFYCRTTSIWLWHCEPNTTLNQPGHRSQAASSSCQESMLYSLSTHLSLRPYQHSVLNSSICKTQNSK